MHAGILVSCAWPVVVRISGNLCARCPLHSQLYRQGRRNRHDTHVHSQESGSDGRHVHQDEGKTGAAAGGTYKTSNCTLYIDKQQTERKPAPMGSLVPMLCCHAALAGEQVIYRHWTGEFRKGNGWESLVN